MTFSEETARTMLDAVPVPLFLLDWNMNVHYANAQGIRLTGEGNRSILEKRWGGMMHCINLNSSEVRCGMTEFCRTCEIRNIVRKVLEQREPVHRREEFIRRHTGEVNRANFSLSASVLDIGESPYALLVMEDITEYIDSKRIMFVCSSCKRIRNPEDRWEKFESYISRHTRFQVSHSICPECMKNLYPDHDDY
jgi:PAS domain-containing protein